LLATTARIHRSLNLEPSRGLGNEVSATIRVDDHQSLPTFRPQIAIW